MFVRKGLIIYMFLLLMFSLVFSNIVFAECPEDKDIGPTIGPTEEGNPTFPECYNIQYSPPPPEEVDPAVTSDLELSIDARNPPPYHWTIDLVDGSGFSLHASVTTGTTNTLYISETACGTTKITVNDEEDQVCQTEIRATSGKWILVDSDGCYRSPNLLAIKIIGGDRWEERWCYKYWYPATPPETDCENTGWCGGCGPFPPHTSAPDFVWAPCYSDYVTCKYCWITSYKHYRWQCP